MGDKPLPRVPRPREYRSCHENICDGYGWEWLDAFYAEKAFPIPTRPFAAAGDPELDRWENQVQDILQTRARAATNTVRPCSACRPVEFDRWATGYPTNHEGTKHHDEF